MHRATLAFVLAVLLAPSTTAEGETAIRPADAEPGLNFGASACLQGTTLLVGAPGNGTVAGRVYVYRSTPDGWVEENRLEAPGSGAFGSAVQLSGNLAFVGAEEHVDSGGNPSGAVFVFERSGTTWGAPTLLLPSNPATATSFGHDVAAEPGRVLVAARDLAYVYEPVGGVWTEVATLSIDAPITDADLSGSRAALGAMSANRVAVFERTAAGWEAGPYLNDLGVPSFSITSSKFGSSVALESQQLAVLNGAACGSFLHGFELRPTGWRKSSVTFAGALPTAVSIHGGRAAISSWDSLRIFRGLPSGGWLEEQLLRLDEPSAAITQSSSAIDGNLAVLGTPWDPVDGVEAGAVWVWQLNSLTGLPDGLSVLSGGAQDFELRRGPHEAYSLYWLFGSATGTSPGLTVDGLPLPLNVDGYYVFLLLNPNTVVQPTIGILDGAGNAPARLELGPLDPALTGITLNHAALFFDLGRGPVVEAISGAVPLRLIQETGLLEEDFESGSTGWTSEGFFGGKWALVEDGACGAVTRMMALSSPAPACGSDLSDLGSMSTLSSPAFRLGRVGDYELRLDSILSPGLEARVRLFVEDPAGTVLFSSYFEVAWPSDFANTGVLQSLSVPVPGIEYALGRDAHFEFHLGGNTSGTPAGWWVDNVELVKLP